MDREWKKVVRMSARRVISARATPTPTGTDKTTVSSDKDKEVEIPISATPTLVLVQMPQEEKQESIQEQMEELTFTEEEIGEQMETEAQGVVTVSKKMNPKAKATETATAVKAIQKHDTADVVMDKYLSYEILTFMESYQEEDISMHPELDDEEILGRDRADLAEDGEGVSQETSGDMKRRRKSGRGRGRGRTSGRPDPFDTSDYKRRSEDPAELCPPPPPKKLKGGNRTRQRDTLSTSVPEGDVQLACVGLKGNEITKRADIRTPLIPFIGTVFTPILRAVLLYDKNLACRIQLMDRASSGIMASDSAMAVIKKAERDRPFELRGILLSGLMNYATECASIGRMLDANEWLTDLAREFWTNPRFRNMKFRSVIADEDGKNRQYEPGVIYHDSLAACLTRTKFDLLANVNDLMSAAIKVSCTLNKSKIKVADVRRKKFFVQENYQGLYQELSCRDSKFDEMSITGVRCIKLLMDGPYLKTEDALLSFQLPLDDFALNMRNQLPFLSEKQKWTSKDLQALKQIIKECVLTKRVDDLNSRYLELLHESDTRRVEEMSREGKPVDAIHQPPQRRRRGRPTKEETSQRDRYGIVYPVLLRHSNIVVAYSILPKQLSEWRILSEKRLRNMSFDTLLKEKDAEALIDWDDVALKIMIRTKKLRLAADCQLTYKHEADPMVNNKRLTAEETLKIQDLYQVKKKNWDEISVEMNRPTLAALASSEVPPLHTPYQYFTRYMSKVVPPKKPVWDEMMDDVVKVGLEEYPGHWRRVASLVGNEAVTKKVVVERYKKAITPLLKIGPFSRVEDCLLLLTIQRLQSFMGVEGHFGSLLAYLPWRYETTWRDRAHNLFNDWIVPWTLEEDRLLLELATKMNRNWQKISEQFSSFKNRKGCLTRFKILDRNLQKNKNSSLEQYHEAYAMTRYNVFQYRHLKEILTVLKAILDNVGLFKGFPRFLMNPDRENPPTEAELQCMLATYDRTVLNDTIVTLEKYIAGRDAYWETWTEKNGNRKRTFDRRTFHPEDPKSVASAIHIRRLKLKPKSDFSDLNDFEEEVYVHYGRFGRTKELKEKAKRPYLPPVSFFVEWKSVKRIIDDNNVPTEDKDVSCSQKWIRLMKKSNSKSQPKDVKKGQSGKKVVNKGKSRQQKRGKKKKVEDTSEEEESDIMSESDEEFEEDMGMSESE